MATRRHVTVVNSRRFQLSLLVAASLILAVEMSTGATLSVKVLVVGGGGGGARGGGGAGGYQYDSAHAIAVTSYAVTVGAGGHAGAVNGGGAANGGNSIFDTITTIGGGAGGVNPANASNGGSGGGAANGLSAGTGSQGNGGGSSGSPGHAATGGGGGASAAGSNTPTDTGEDVGGAGGAGTSNTISGSAVTYGGGGGGGAVSLSGGNRAGGAGGAGGGGTGGSPTNATAPTAGTSNTGGGGGGGGYNGTAAGGYYAYGGANGGSGVVIIRYTTGSLTATGGTITTVGGDTVHTFTASGTFTVSAVAPPTSTPNQIVKYDASGNLAASVVSELNGNIGIGTANPAQKLSVAGAIESTVGGFKFPDGTVQTTAGSSGPGNGSWLANGANMFFNTGNVGIGTSTPASRLHLDGDLTISRNGVPYVHTETNALPMIFFKGPAYDGGAGTASGRLGLYGDTAFLSDNLSFNMTNWVADDNTIGRAAVLLQKGGIFFQTQVADGPDGVINRMIVEASGDVYMAKDSGNVGIGTMTPASKLHVVGNVTVDGNIAAKYQDVAEWVDAREPMTAGTVVAISEDATNIMRPSARGYETAVAGVVSPQPGITLGEAGDGRVLVAHTGRVRVKVDASFGAIHAGDLLVTSPTPGHAMRSAPSDVSPGTLLGKALESLAAGRGEILVLITLQ